jgi:hypothetical protein
MKLLQDNLNALGNVTYTAYFHDEADNTDSKTQRGYELAGVVADPVTCRISYHYIDTLWGSRNDWQLRLHEVQGITVKTELQEMWPDAVKIDPPIFLLKVLLPDNGTAGFLFYDEQQANRMAKIMSRAVELCGGSPKAPTLPITSGSGPSLAATMKFIQDSLNGQGKVNFVAYVHDNLASTDWAYQASWWISNVKSDPDNCRFALRAGNKMGDAGGENPNLFTLQDVRSLKVMPFDQFIKAENAVAKHPSWDTRSDPPVFVLLALRDGIIGNYPFVFSDEDMANRVAKAMVHAVELCGGGNKNPF